MRSEKQIIARAEKAAATLGRTATVVHSLFMEALTHYKEHGDTTTLGKIVAIFHQSGADRASMVQWICYHAGARFVVEKETFRKVKDFDHTTVNLAKADDDPYFLRDQVATVTKIADAKRAEFDLLKKMEALIAKAESVLHDAPEPDAKVVYAPKGFDDATVRTLKDMVAAVRDRTIAH